MESRNFGHPSKCFLFVKVLYCHYQILDYPTPQGRDVIYGRPMAFKARRQLYWPIRGQFHQTIDAKAKWTRQKRCHSDTPTFALKFYPGLYTYFDAILPHPVVAKTLGANFAFLWCRTFGEINRRFLWKYWARLSATILIQLIKIVYQIVKYHYRRTKSKYDETKH